MRKENWPEILAGEIKAAKSRPFSWGQHDCCAFAARVVQALTGEDFLQDFPAYHDAVGAGAILGEGTVEDIANVCLGEPIPPLSAQRGDVCLIDTPDGPALGICDGAWIWCAARTGLNCRPLADARHAWRVA